jgi:exodeoxyribonuclease V alpha subunit
LDSDSIKDMTSSLIAHAFSKMLLDALHASPQWLGEFVRFDRPLSVLFERVWMGSTEGNACIELDPEDLSLLQQSGAHALMGEALPLMLDERALYLNRFWQAERRLADHIHRRLESSTIAQSLESKPLNRDFPDEIAAHLKDLAPAQVEAVLAGLSRRLSIIYGGPGTGKTRTIASLILCYAQIFKKPIWVAAPTSKAGGRLMESLRALLLEAMPKVEVVSPSAQGPLELSLLPDLGSFALPSEALTIQRLLSQLPSQEVLFRDHDDADSGLEAPGLLIIDEASMLSLELCEEVFARLSPDCILVLVGDPDQLHSVETGSVFAALCQAEWPAMKSARIQLTRNFRQSNRLHLSGLADNVLRGRIDSFMFGGELVLNAPELRSMVEAAAQRYAGLLREAKSKFTRDTSNDQKSLRYLETTTNYRLLSARRSGIAGADRMSELVLYRLKKLLNLSDQAWFEGRIITIIKNDPESGLLNGDVGVCISINEPQPLIVFLRHGDVQIFPAALLPRFQDAYCLSVHQSQGSEFDHVDFIAAPAGHQLATRELLYTAVTRAKHSLNIWGELVDLQWAASHPTIRQSRLRWRIDHP